MASPPVADFREHSQNIVRNFLQTIVVVDDRAYFEKTESSVRPTVLESPARPSFTETKKDTSLADPDAAQPVATMEISPEKVEPEIEQAKTAEETSEDRAHELNAKQLIDSFADRGIACAVFRPSKFEFDQLDKRVHALAGWADVVMLDWVLHEDTEGKKVKQLIAEIAKKSFEQNRLQLVVIYTGELRLSGIIDEIEKVLTDSGASKVLRKDDFTVESGATRITIYGKSNVDREGLADELRPRMAPLDQLPAMVVTEFTNMTSGLISNVALDSLAALRSNTHRILAKFNPAMDAPFLAHRAMLDQPDDASNLLVQLVTGELTAVLEGNEVGKVADAIPDLDVIKAWISDNEAEGYDFAKRFGAGKQANALDQLNTLLRKGVLDETLKAPFDSFKKDPHKRDLTHKLASPSESAPDLEHQFAILTTLKSNYRSETNFPLLFPGTLLKEAPANGAEGSYLMCIQPICDCLRIKETRSFPFLRLRLATENAPAFDLILPDGGAYVRVRLEYSPYTSRLIDFNPSESLQAIISQLQHGNVIFTATDGTVFEWIAELKFEQTQRIVNNYAAQLARVGLDESEWLRRWAKR
jgi:response regulator receiver domain-containing protein